MPWIANHSFAEVNKGTHTLEPGRTALIRIGDAATMFFNRDVYHFDKFAAVREYDFQDIEDIDAGAMNEEQAADMVAFLQEALRLRLNVVVHCVQGLCRSGAVVEAGVAMGFQDAEILRLPNLHVKKLLLKHAGLLDGWDEAADRRRLQELTAKHFMAIDGNELEPRMGDI